jgi:hypothetical protein
MKATKMAVVFVALFYGAGSQLYMAYLFLLFMRGGSTYEPVFDMALAEFITAVFLFGLSILSMIIIIRHYLKKGGNHEQNTPIQ